MEGGCWGYKNVTYERDQANFSYTKQVAIIFGLQGRNFTVAASADLKAGENNGAIIVQKIIPMNLRICGALN